MLFVVSDKNNAENLSAEFPYVVLERDNWDDFHYKTTFTAELSLSENETIDLGSLKILKIDQTKGFTPMPKQPFQELGPEYCSLGQDVSYYEKLFKAGRAVYQPYLKGLSDVAYDDKIKAKFENLEGFKVSLSRFGGAERTISDAVRLFRRVTPSVPRQSQGFVVQFKTTLAENANSFLIKFDFRRKAKLPHRMNVLIGYNGTGKTRLLSNLAIVASGYGYGNKEDMLNKRAGRFVGNPPPFNTVVVVSYSAFDTFVIPGQTEIEKARLQEEGRIFSYVYCGLRELASEGKNQQGQVYRLRTPAETEAEFLSSLRRVREANRLNSLIEILRPMLLDPSFQRIGLTKLYSDYNPRNEKGLAELFRGLSSGHKVVLKIIIDLTAHVDDSQPTLILIDEPETHLHPPLLAAFLKSVRACLDEFDAYAIVATHSPVVLQETPSRFVHVLRRIGDQSAVASPSIETFGENIGVITQDVFNLDDGSTDWHDTLRWLAKHQSLNEIEDTFEHRLGFGPKSYVISLQEENSDE